MVSDVTGKLEMGPAVLGKWGKEGIKLCLGKTDDVGSGFFSELLKVELSGSVKGFNGGRRSGRGQGVDDVGVGIDGSGLKSVWVDESDASASRQCGILGGLEDVDIVWAGASRFEEGEAGDGKLEAEFGTGGNGGRPGDDRG